MPHPKLNLSYFSAETVIVEPRTGKLTPEGMLLVRTLNGLLDRSGGMTAQALPLRNYTVATLPSASAHQWGLIAVSDGASNKRLAISDGSNWRFPDGAVVS